MFRLGARTSLTVLRRPSRTLLSFGGQSRGYALSRFPEPRRPGGSRQTRSSLQRPSKSAEQETDTFRVEQRPSTEESPLWQASQREPASDPAEGMRRLLMENDLLVITRYVEESLVPAVASGSRLDRQIEMMNIFLGFEQANKYVISTAGDLVNVT